MKKALSIVLALIMIMSSCMLAFAAEEKCCDNCTETVDCRCCEECLYGATGTYRECKCSECTKTAGCICCVFCPYLNEAYVLSCAEVVVGSNGEKRVVLCCENCKGVFPCECGVKASDCSCVICDGKSKEANESEKDPLLSEEQQKDFVTAFQKIIKVLENAFNKFFDAIFEFLRIEEVV